jgi:hypothetical protein
VTTIHDDLPHPVPAFAQLRYKENYFFIILAERSDVFGVIHFNHEPGFDRARYTANLSVQGKPIRYANQTPFPTDYAYARGIGDGRLTLDFKAPHQRFDLALRTDEVDLTISFTARFETFDYAACRTAGNPAPSFQEIMTLGTNLPYNHQQQALDVTGSVTLAGGQAISVKGSGYRDHSWVMRCDSIGETHSWCGLTFPDRAFGAKIISTTYRPGLFAREGYVVDAKGPRALRLVETRPEGELPDGLPARLIHDLEDVFGERYTVEADIENRYAHVPLVAEAPAGKVSFNIVENFCPLRLIETGERGIGLVEIGRSSTIGGPFA